MYQVYQKTLIYMGDKPCKSQLKRLLSLLRSLFYGSWISAARSVLFISMAMVIGPTPPGTGVM